MIQKLQIDLEKIRCLSEEKSEENWAFRSFLKMYDGNKSIDKVVHNSTKRFPRKLIVLSAEIAAPVYLLLCKVKIFLTFLNLSI